MAAAVHTMNYNDFFSHYTKATTKEEEAVAILEVVQEAKREQAQEVAEKKQEILKEINLKDFATKADLQLMKSELMNEMSGVRLEVHREISKAKWQLLGGALALVVIPIILRHFGM